MLQSIYTHCILAEFHLKQSTHILLIALVVQVLSAGFGCRNAPDKGRSAQPSQADTEGSVFESLGLLPGRELARQDAPKVPPWVEHYGPDYTGIVDLAWTSGNQLFLCSGVGGLVHVDARKPDAMKTRRILGPASPDFTYLSGAEGFGRCDHLTVDADIVYVTHQSDAFVRPSFIAAYRIDSKDTKPLFLHTDTERVFGGIGAHGQTLYVAEAHQGLGIYVKEGTTLRRSGTLEGLSQAYDVARVSNLLYVAGGRDGLVVVDITPGQPPAIITRIPEAKGRHLHAAANRIIVSSGTDGVIVLDKTVARRPKLLRRIPTAGFPGQTSYSPEHDLLAVADWYEVRLYDLSQGDSTTPSRPIGSVRIGLGKATTLTLAVAIHKDLLFVGDWYGVHSFRVFPKRRSPRLELNTRLVRLKQGKGAITIGNQGRKPLTVRDFSVASKGFTLSPNTFVLKPGSQKTVTLSRDTEKTPKDTTLTFKTNDPLEPEVSVTLTEASIPTLEPHYMRFRTREGQQWLPETHRGKVILLAYFASFCPPCFHEFPDLETHVWNRYKSSDDVLVVGVASPVDSPKMIGHFIKQTGITFPIVFAGQPAPVQLGRPEELITYFPLDVIIDRDGKIADVSTVMDVSHLIKTIESLRKKP